MTMQQTVILTISVLLTISQFCFQLSSCIGMVLFNYTDFRDMTNITFVQSNSSTTSVSARSLPSSVKLLPNPALVKLTENQSASTWSGWMSYNQSIAFLDSSKKALSFNTSFTFKMNTPGNYGDCPSGMAFFILSKEGSPSNFSSKYFGLADDTTVSPVTNPFFAVEFDTYKTAETNDPSSSHIGIDISSLNSVKYIDTSNKSSNGSNPYYPQLYLYNNLYNFRVWISYDSSVGVTKVWMTNISTLVDYSPLVNPSKDIDYSTYLNPPNGSVMMPILQLQYDLSPVFAPNNMYIGFSAATQTNTAMLGVSIKSWYFSISQDNTVDQTSPSPSPQVEPSAPAILQSGKPQIPSQTTEDPGSQHSSMKLGIILPVTSIGIVAMLAVVTLAIGCHLNKLKKTGSEHLQHSTNDQNADMNDPCLSVIALPRYSYQEMQSSTNNFDRNSSLIGEGGFSQIFKGKLEDGSMVAIKKIKDGVRKEAEFFAELKMINTIRHRNLLQLQGWCYENGETLLVYKFMSNGSLERFIFGEKRGSLDGSTRLRILSGVAAALQYLHFGLGYCVLHRDVKAANVLVADDFEAVLGDFGLARLIKHNESVTATMVGTVGYIAPEVILEGKVTDRADVYSFGVLALEVACGRKVIIKNPNSESQECDYLVELVSQLQRRNSLIDVLDRTIFTLESIKPVCNISEVQEQWMRLLKLALLCCQRTPESRPNMTYVHQEIHNIRQGYDADMPFPSPVETNESDVVYPFLRSDQIRGSRSSTHDYSLFATSTSSLDLPR